MSARALIALLTCASLGSLPAIAQDDVERAKRHVEKAEQHYSLAEFPAAVEEFKAAYRLVPRPGILFNLGQCYLQMKDYPNAEFSYRAYLRAVPDADNKQMVEELLAQATSAIAVEQQRASMVTAEDARAHTGEAMLMAGLTAASLGGGVGVASLFGVALLEIVFVTELGGEEERRGLFWFEKALGAAAAMGIAAVLVGGTLAASSALVE